ncbi:MAG: glycine zipper 2TM domain-containing protein [Steroidobacteraceae bacterium]
MPTCRTAPSALVVTLAATSLAVLAACGGPAPAPTTDGGTPPTTATGPTEAERAAELAAREQEVAARENELAKQELEQKEQALARQQAELAAQQDALAKQAAKVAAAKAAAAKPAVVARKPAEKPVRAAPVKLLVPAGTNLTIALSSAITTKTAKPGDTIGGIVVSDVLAGGKVAIPAGSRVWGGVTNVVSGSNKIGGVPVLGLHFDTLELPDGQQFAVNGAYQQQGRSDTGRDTAKILGGAAAGAVIGHQVDNSDKGKVIGGLLGGAAGAIAAKKTGAEVELPQDATLTIATGAPIEVVKR